MTSEERGGMQYLCQRIAEEKDPEIFGQLLQELDVLLEQKHQRINPERPRKPKWAGGPSAS